MPTDYVPYSDVYYDDQPPAHRGRPSRTPTRDRSPARGNELAFLGSDQRRDRATQALQRREHSADEYNYDDYEPRRSRRRRDSPPSNYASAPHSRSRTRRDHDFDRRDRDRDRDRDRPPRRSKSEQDIRNRVNRGLDKVPFDKSNHGLLASAAGAGLGAYTARRFGGENDKHYARDRSGKSSRQGSRQSSPWKNEQNWKTAGGALLGAAIGNVAESKFKDYSKDKVEGKYEKTAREAGRRDRDEDRR